jgi:hypothetical protein
MITQPPFAGAVTDKTNLAMPLWVRFFNDVYTSIVGLTPNVTYPGDSSLTLDPKTLRGSYVWKTALSAPRTITISTGAGAGQKIRFTRTSAATGSTLTFGSTVIAAGQWMDVEFDGSAWVETAGGTLI